MSAHYSSDKTLTLTWTPSFITHLRLSSRVAE